MSTSPISRRTVAKGIAWTAPAISVAAAAPALAASPGDSGEPGTPTPPVVDKAISHAAKCQGNNDIPEGKGYRVFLSVSPVTAPAPIIVSAVNGSGNVQKPHRGPTAVAGKPGVYEYLVLGESSAKWLTLQYRVGDGKQQSVTIPADPQCGGYKF